MFKIDVWNDLTPIIRFFEIFPLELSLSFLGKRRYRYELTVIINKPIDFQANKKKKIKKFYEYLKARSCFLLHMIKF